MRLFSKAAVLGGDARTKKIIEGLHHAYPHVDIALWGTEQVGEMAAARRCVTWQEAMLGADVSILPLPIARDGAHLLVDAHVNQNILLEEICSFPKPGSLLLGGMVPPVILRLAEENAVVFRDYYADEVVQQCNAIPTAEGAMAIAIQELPIILPETTALITGYGRVAKALSIRLKMLGARVIVAARRREALACAACDGCETIPIGALELGMPEIQVLFNTIPAPVLTEKVLASLDPQCLVVELAKGVAEGTEIPPHIRFIAAPSLPGRIAPHTAGRILCESILHEIGLWQRKETLC